MKKMYILKSLGFTPTDYGILKVKCQNPSEAGAGSRQISLGCQCRLLLPPRMQETIFVSFTLIITLGSGCLFSLSDCSADLPRLIGHSVTPMLSRPPPRLTKWGSSVSNLSAEPSSVTASARSWEMKEQKGLISRRVKITPNCHSYWFHY